LLLGLLAYLVDSAFHFFAPVRVVFVACHALTIPNPETLSSLIILFSESFLSEPDCTKKAPRGRAGLRAYMRAYGRTRGRACVRFGFGIPRPLTRGAPQRGPRAVGERYNNAHPSGLGS
jgi:hypothetical protein